MYDSLKNMVDAFAPLLLSTVACLGRCLPRIWLSQGLTQHDIMRRARQLAVRVPASILRPCQQLVLRTAVRATAVAHHSVATAQWTAVAVPQRLSQVAGLHTSAARAGGDDNVVNVPSMGDSIVDCTVSDLEVPVGSYVNEDDVVAVLESDKVRGGGGTLCTHCTTPPPPALCWKRCGGGTAVTV